MDEDESVLPANHPLRTYLQSLNLDEETAVSTKEIPTDDTATPTKPLVNFHWLSQFINSQIEASKKGIFECILTSNHLVEDDYVILEHYCAMLPTKPSEASQLQPINLSLIALGVLVLAVSLCVTPISLAAAFLIGIFSLWVLLRLVALRVFVVLIKRIIADLKEFHESVKKSAHFLQGLTYSEWGLTFAAAGMNRRASASSVFPSFTRLLHKVTVDYLTQVSQLSRAASDVFHDASVVDAGGCLAEVSPEVTADAAADASLSSIKALFEFVLFMDSELLRRIGCFLSLQTPRPLKFTCRFGYIVFLWLWTLHCSKRDLVELNQIRCQLQSGSLPKDRPLHKPTQSVCSPDDLQLKHHRLFLESLHFHLINWSNRLQHLKDRLAEKDPAIDLEEFVSPDLTVMRLLLKNCQLCLDEAERALHPPQPTTTDAQEVPPTPIASTHEATEPKSLDSEDPVVDDECLEAIVDESDLAPTDLDSFYDEWDFSGRPITKAELKDRKAARAVLLTELNSVIAHRLVETREREMRALLRSRGALQPSPEASATLLSPAETSEVNGGGDVNRSQANQDIDSDRKECADLASRQRSLTNAATPSSGDAPAPETTLSDAEGPFCGVPGATSVGFISPLVADLKTAFLSRGEPMKSEETFDGIGVGLDVPDDCESGVD